MTNREWLIKEMQNMSDADLCALLQGGVKIIVPIDKIDVTRGQCICNWLKEEHKEIPELTEAERVILKNIDKKYKWIVRDANSSLWVWEEEPTKNNIYNDWDTIDSDYETLDAFIYLFEFVKWENEKPYNIEELLKGE